MDDPRIEHVTLPGTDDDPRPLHILGMVVGPDDDIEAAFDAMGDAIGAAGIRCDGCGNIVNSPECKVHTHE